MDLRDEVEQYVTRGEGKLAEDKSPLYVDVKAMITRPQLLYSVITQIGDLILKNHHGIKAIGSHGVGGIFLISPVMLHVYNHWFDVNGFFLHLGAEGGHERDHIEGCLEKGWRVLIIDTLMKTGNSGLEAHEILTSFGCEVDGIIVVADLSGGDNACTRAGIRVESLITL